MWFGDYKMKSNNSTYYHAINTVVVQEEFEDNQNPYIEEDQTTQWPKEKVQKDKQRSTKHRYKAKDRVTRNPQFVFRTQY